MQAPRKDVRNLAIIAHVDHGKTTLLDGLLRQTGALPPRHAAVERVMDSEDLERERGITIHAKNTAIDYEGVHIHLVDTPGHADFGGEVERVLGMVDAVLLLVDAVEGVMPQTRFVLRKALEHGLRPILVVNKIDRPEQRAAEVLDEVFDLLVELGANDDAARLPGGLRVGEAGHGRGARGDAPRTDLRPLLDTILEHAPPPSVDLEGPLQFQAMTLAYDDFVGRLVIGRVERGRLRRGATVVRVPAEGLPQSFRVTKLFGAHGLDRREIEEALAGDLVDDRGRRLDRHRRHGLRPGQPRGAAARRDRSADRARALLGQQLAVRGPRGPLRHVAPDRRAAAPRGARQRLDQDRRRPRAPTSSRSRAAARCRSAC